VGAGDWKRKEMGKRKINVRYIQRAEYSRVSKQQTAPTNLYQWNAEQVIGFGFSSTKWK
jgi:hypothetical protein